MKKSFLKRVMAAVVAVPVALSQTVLFASFAEGETAADGGKTITAKSLVNIPTDAVLLDTITGPTNALGGLTPDIAAEGTYYQESNWYKELNTALQGFDGDTPIDLSDNIKNLKDDINSQAWYADIAKDALGKGAVTAQAVVDNGEQNVVISVDADYDYSEALETLLKRGVPSEYKYLADEIAVTATSNAVGHAQVIADTSKLATDKSVDFTVVVKDKDNKTLATPEAIAAYVKGIVDGQVRTDAHTAVDKVVEAHEKEFKKADDDLKAAQKAGVDTTEAQAKYDAAKADYDRAVNLAGEEIDKVLDKILDNIDTAVTKYENNVDNTYNKTVEKPDYDAAYTAVYNWADSRYTGNKAQKLLNRVPETLDGFVSNATLNKLFDGVVEQVNAASKAYTFDVTLASAAEVVKSVTEVTVHGEYANKVGSGYTFGFLPTEADAAALIETVNAKLLEDAVVDEDGNQLEVDEIEWKDIIEAAGDGSIDTFSGHGEGNVYRVIWYTTKPIIEETTDTTEESTEVSETETDTDETETDTETTETETETDTETTETDTEPTETDTTPTETDTEPTETDTTPTETDTEPTETTEPIEDPFNIDIAVEGEANFYFSHDPRAFTVEKLITKATYTQKDGTVRDLTDEEKANITFGYNTNGDVEGLTPEQTFNALGEAYDDVPLYVYYNHKLVTDSKGVQVLIGVKGDANLSGGADSEDAADVLTYAATVGAGKEAHLNVPTKLERFAYFLADTSGESLDLGKTSTVPGAEGESKLDAEDAAQILSAAAFFGAQGKCDWTYQQAVLGEPFPAYSAEIHETYTK